MSEIIETYEFNIDYSLVETRLDLALSTLLEGTSRNYIQKLFQRDLILVNGTVCNSKKYKCQLNDIIRIDLPKAEEPEIKGENIPIEIVYEDEDVLIVNKPSGMVVHPAVGNYSGTLVNAIMYHCENRLSSINGVIRPGIVHRIDKDTSGLLMIAKNDIAHESLSKQLAEHSLTRVYYALCYGNIKEDKGTIDKPLGRDPKNRMKRAVLFEHSKSAVTHYKVLERFGNYTLIECRLETGRTHQIRVHMAYVKHPLVGDPLYGPSKSKIAADGQYLHAKTIGFIHPKTNVYMEFDSRLPERFEKLLERLRGE